jgi:hypothetical protein
MTYIGLYSQETVTFPECGRSLGLKPNLTVRLSKGGIDPNSRLLYSDLIFEKVS